MRKKSGCSPHWLIAAREAEIDVAGSPDRTLTIDQAAQRRAVLPDVVRRQLAALAYVRRHADVDMVRAGMSAVENLMAVDRANPRAAIRFRKSVLLGEISIRDLRALIAKSKSAKSELVPVLAHADLAARFLADIPKLHILPEQDKPEAHDRSWIGAEYIGALGELPSTRKWAWVGIVAPSVAWSCLRGAPVRDLVRCAMAASLWSDVISVALTSPQEIEAIRDAFAPAPITDRARVWLHDLGIDSGTDRLG